MKKSKGTPVCNKDCFNCPHPDCILDALDAQDYAALKEMDRALVRPRTKEQQKLAAKQKAYYEANKDEIAAKQKAYYEANKDEIAAKRKAYREANREAWNAYMREYSKRKKVRPHDA